MKNYKKNFTLIELLVVITILAILMSILQPALRKTLFTAKLTACKKKQKQIGLAILMYTDDYYDLYPTSGIMRTGLTQWTNGGSHSNTDQRMAPYLGGMDSNKAVICPNILDAGLVKNTV